MAQDFNGSRGNSAGTSSSNKTRGIGGHISSGIGKGAKSMGVIGIGTAAFTAFDWKSNMSQGDSFGVAGAKAVGTGLLWHTNPALMWSYTAATTVPAMYKTGREWYRKRSDEYSLQKNSQANGVIGGGYQDTQRAQTMRQAAIQAIEGSKLNARSALGGEAKIYRDSWNRYYG